MNALLVYAHPEPVSLNGSLKTFLVKHLVHAPHIVHGYRKILRFHL
jgi:NAD(P)H dehydrogenase (quinone)